MKAPDGFFPETYRLDFVPDLIRFLDCKTGGLWVEKKGNSSCGNGIKLIGDVEQYKLELLNKKEDDKETSTDLFLKKMAQMEAAEESKGKANDE